MSKQVPVPSKGRIVFFRPPDLLNVYPAMIVDTNHPSPQFVRLCVFTFDGVYNPVHDISYGENKPGCWWWPPREERTMEVE